MSRLIFLIIFFLIQSCVFVKGKTDVYIPLGDLSTSSGGSSLDFPFSKMTILAGDTMTFTTTNGVGPYTANTYSTGTFNSGTTAYSAPDSSAPYSFNVEVTDSNGLIGNMPVEIIGFKEKFFLEQIKTFGDQNFPTSIAQSTDGSLYASSIFIDGTGWEDWGVWKSIDNGSTWIMVDKYLMYLYGESHPLEIATKGNDVYVCGYVWGSSGTPSTANSEWLVKKSSDGGATWSVVDHWWGSTNDNICGSIAVSPSGNIFASGYSYNGGYHAIIRMSADDGATWQEIGNFTGAGTYVANNVRVSANGDVWASVHNDIYKGVFTAGSWNWSGPYSITASNLGWVAYEKQGELTVVSNTQAFYTGQIGSNWKVFESIDAGVTWSEIYSGTGEGVSIKVLSTGEIISSGNRSVGFSEKYHEIIKSSDSGSTFNLVMQSGGNTNTTKEEGGFLVELLNGDVLSLGMRYLDDQMLVFRSTDKGDNWTQASIITFYDRFYSSVSDYAEDSLGNIFTAGWVSNVDPLDPSEPYVIMKSSNNGSTWTQSDYNKQSGEDHASDQIEINILDNIFATDYSFDSGISQLRMSTNQGASWSTVDTSTISGTANYLLATDTAGNVYYSSSLALRRGNPDGTGFVDAYTFPITGAQSSPKASDLIGLSDGSLLLAIYAVEATIGYKLIYRSTDQGATWTELYRIVGSQWTTFKLYEDQNGDYISLINGSIYRSSDTGASWSEIYNSATYGSAQSLVISNDSRIFFNANYKIYSYSANTSSWNLFWNINTVLTPNIDSEIASMFKCKFSPIGVCAAIIDYTKYDGYANYMWTAE